MNIKKQLLAVSIIFIIAILGFCSVSNAYDYNVGDSVNISYMDYISNEDIYCVEYNQALIGTQNYEVISKVVIEGRKSIDHKGKVIEHDDNAKFVKILTSDNGTDKESGPVQNAIWNFGSTWMKSVGKNHNGLFNGFMGSSTGTNIDLGESDYANQLKYMKFIDNTDKSNIKANVTEKEGKQYIRIGPFNWSFPGTITEVPIYDQNDKEISNVLYSTYKGTTEKVIKVSEIKTDSDFYVLIPANQGVTKITKISAKSNVEVAKATVWFLKSTYGYQQNLIIREPSKGTQEIKCDFDYNIPLKGNLKVIKIDEDNNTIKLQGVGFYIQHKQTGKYIKQNSNGTISYVDKRDATEFVTDKNGEILVKNLIVGTYVAYETKNPNFGYEIIKDGQEKNIVVDKTTELKIKNKRLKGSLKVIKIDSEDNTIRLPGVGFYIQHKEIGKYVKQNSNGTISYVDKKDATEFITDKNGEIFVKDLIIGTYVAYETQNPNFGYEIIKDGQELEVVVNKTEEYSIGNKPKRIKLSGYVWVDKIYGKQSLRNDLYKDNDYDSFDILLDGITVRLKDKSGNLIGETKTANGGAYSFIDILVKELSNYYIEFEYDGLTYTNVIPHIDKDNGSKAAENTTTRTNFNSNFAIVEGESRNTGYTTDSSYNRKHNLTYNIDETSHTATLINNGKYLINANTDEAKYKIIDSYKEEMTEIKNINLGLYEREQPDLAVMKDIQNVRLAINGYEHTYNYAQRFENQGEYGDGFNVGVKFGNKYSSMSYTRPIYKSDYEYVNENDKSKELKVYITYKIALKNQSTNLSAQVNSIVDYFDSKYTIKSIGTSLDAKGDVVVNSSMMASGNNQITKYDDNYNKYIIPTNIKIDAQQQSDIYVQFELNREAVINILNNRENLENVVEINSYSVFDKDGNIYAGIDKDSNPGNAIPGNTATYEDDTDSSPALKLEVANARELAGKVFLDSTEEGLLTGRIRQGSGAYEQGEAGIPNVEIVFTEKTGSGKEYKATTDTNGDFLIADFIPGDYVLTYVWGDETYTVQKYKGTIYDKERYQNNLNNKEWYKQDVEIRLNDAVDNYETRQKIDQGETLKMDSTTPTMGIGVEYDTTYTASTGDKYTYRINNVDFGIVERARQDLALIKRINTLKLTLANGQVIADVSIDENGNLTGEERYVSYMPPSDNLPKNGYLKIEIDNELMEGAYLEVQYKITAKNNSEVEYLTEDYYKYGITGGDVATITPTAIIDYLDDDWNFDKEANQGWETKTLDDIKGIVAEVVYKDENSKINETTILYTEALKDKKLKPEDKETIYLNVSKLLSVSQEINLDNEIEILRIERTSGGNLTFTPGNYIPGAGKTESDDDMAEEVIVTSKTGDNLNFIVPISIVVSALVILGAGVIFIKKKILNK